MMMMACFLIPNHDRFNTLSLKSAIYCGGFYDLNDMIKDLLINLICWDEMINEIIKINRLKKKYVMRETTQIVSNTVYLQTRL